MNTKINLKLAVAVVSLSFFTPLVSADDPPNIVFILADDLAWADTQFNGNQFFETPNIDRLAADGIMFDQCYSGGPNCAPTRACLMTGMYTPRHHLYTPGGRSKGNKSLMQLLVPGVSKKGNQEFQSNKNWIDAAHVCIPELLKQAGYATARMGKWHLGVDTQGFDISTSDGRDGPGKKHYGSTTVAESLTDAALKFIEENKDRPFFLYLAHWDVHGPIRAKKELVDKYSKKIALTGGIWRPAYAGMVEQVDTSVARIRNKIEDLGLADNTLIVFTSDNGGAAQFTTNKPLKGAKGSLYEGGIRVPGCAYWKGVTVAGSKVSIPITSVDFLPTFCELAGVEPPKIQPVDGRSILRLIKGADPGELAERAIFWHFPLYLSGFGEGQVIPAFDSDKMVWRATPSSAIRKGDWKLIHLFEDDSTRLFNLSNDPYEQNDLSSTQPEKRDGLWLELQKWQKETSAPIPTKTNPEFGKDVGKKKTRKKKTNAQDFRIGRNDLKALRLWDQDSFATEMSDSSLAE